MFDSLEVLFAPAEFAALSGRDLSQTTCVVFDILRATSTIVTTLANGASAIIPVAEISEVLELRRQNPELLLAGERDGLRIRADLTGSIDFDFGNSPREFAPAKINGRTIVLTTTNGSRALRACAPARAVLAGSFLNLRATADFLHRHSPPRLLLVCSGTHDQSATEDVLGAGALIDLLFSGPPPVNSADSAFIAWQVYQSSRENLLAAISLSRNGRRLLSQPELRDDVSFCLQPDTFPLVAKVENGMIRKVNE